MLSETVKHDGPVCDNHPSFPWTNSQPLNNIQHKYAFCSRSSLSLFTILPIKTLTIVLDARVFIQFKDETFGTKTVEEKLPLSSM